MSIKKYIVVFMLCVAIVLNSSFLRVMAEEDTSNGLMIWTAQSRELYGNSYGSQVFGCTDDEAKIIYDTLVDKLDFSVYDEYIVYMKADTYTTQDSTIFVVGAIGETDMRCIFSGAYYTGATFVSSGFNNVMIEGSYCEKLYVSQFNYRYGVGITETVSANELHSNYLTWSDTGLYGFVNHSGTAWYYTGTLLYSTVPVYCGYDYQASLGLDTNAHVYNKPDIDSYCVDYSQQAYGYNGKSVVKYDASASDDAYSFENVLCFDSFQIEKIRKPTLPGEIGAVVRYSMGDELYNAVRGNPQWKMNMDFTITYSVTEYDNGLLSGGGRTVSSDVVYSNVVIELDNYITQDGTYEFDFSQIDSSPYLLRYLLLTENVDNSNSIFGGKLGQTILNAIDNNYYGSGTIAFEADKYYKVNYLDVACELRMSNDTTMQMSNSAWGHCDLTTSENSSYCNTYDEATGESVRNDDTLVSGNNYYNVVTETDTNGNTYYNYYYYDTNSNTVTPSIGSGVTEIIMTFANPLVLEGVNIDNSSNSSSGGSGGGSSGNIPELVIEDDDYTDTALREDLKDGFGLFDDTSTDTKADGYLNMAASFFNNIDPELQDILTFGISSVVVIGILRSALKR